MNDSKKQEKTLTIGEFINLLMKNFTLLLVVVFIFTGSAFIYAQFQTKIYKSSLTFIEEKNNNSSSGTITKLLGEEGYMQSKTEEMDRLMIYLNSRRLKERVLVSLSLIDYYTKTASIKAFESYDTIQWFEKIIDISKNKETGLYTITAEIKDRDMAAKIANGYFTELQNYLKNEASGQKKSRLIYLEQNIMTLERDILKKEKELRNIEKKYNTVSLDEDAKIIVEQISELKKKILSLSASLNTANQFYGPKSYEVQQIKKEIEEAQKQVLGLESGNSELLKSIPLSEIPDIKMQVEKIKRELSANKSVYDLMRTEYEALKLEVVRDMNSVVVIDQAIPADKPIKPDKKLIVAMGIVLGFMVAVIVILFKGDKKIDAK